MSLGIWELMLILAIVFVLFGAGKLPQVMKDLGQGVRSLKEGLKGEQKQEADKNQTAQPGQLGQNKSAQNESENKSDKNS